MVELLLLAAGGATLVAAVLSARQRDRTRRHQDRVRLTLRFPREVTTDQAREALAAVLRGSGFRRFALAVPDAVGVELGSTASGLEHQLLVPRRHLEAVRAQLHSAIPGLRVEAAELAEQAWTWAVELRLTAFNRPLRSDHPAAVSRSILASLQPLRSGERLIVQWILASAPPARPVVGGTIGLAVGNALPFVRRTTSQPSADELRAARAKQSSPLVWAVLRVGVIAADRGRQRQLAGRVVSSLSATAAPGVRLTRRQLAPAWVARATRRGSIPLAAFPILLNTDEMVGLLGWPLESPSLPGLVLARGRRLAPAASIPSRGRVVARANFPGQERDLAQGADSPEHGTWVVGPTGSGKSHLLTNLIQQDLARPERRSVVVIDAKADLIEAVLDRLPAGREDDVVLLDPVAERATGLNPLADRSQHPEVVADQIFGTLRKLWRLESAPRTSDLLHGALVTLAQVPDMSLIELVPLLTNPAFRRHLTARFAADPVLGPFWAGFESLSEPERAQVVAPTLTRLRQFLLRSSLRTMLGQGRPAIGMRQAIDSGRVVLVPLAAGKIGSEAAALVGALVMAELWVATLARASQPPEQRRPTSVFVDEWQTVAHLPTDMADVLAQSRGYRVGYTLANQSPAQLPPSLREAVASNARSKIAFAASAQDSHVLAREFGPDVAAADIQGLGRHEVMVSLASGAVASPPVTGTTLPLGPPTGRAEDIRRRALEEFGRDRAQVDTEIGQRLGQSDLAESSGRRRRQP